MVIDEPNSKTHILNTAVILFSTHGYKETSIREISKAADVSISMISYYFGGKEGILRDIVTDVTKGFTSLLDQIELTDTDLTIMVLKRFLEFLENNRPRIKILFSELGKGYDYLIPVKEKIKDLQVKLGNIILGKNKSNNSHEFTRKLKIMTDILLGMILSDYIFDFSSFHESIPEKEKKLWREDKIQMLIKIIRQLSGIDSGKLTFDSILRE